jgi:hypothetical protein
LGTTVDEGKWSWVSIVPGAPTVFGNDSRQQWDLGRTE